jgi:iron complex transport system ATP-binding protein
VSAVLEARELAIGYRRPGSAEVQVACIDSLQVGAGELVCLLGPNGAGKSTLLRTLAGLQRPLAGEVLLLGDELGSLTARQLARRVSVVLTEAVDAGALSARELVALGRHPHTGWLGRLGEEDEVRVDEALEAVGATHLASKELRSTSDGERQRVLIARALAQSPRLMILDEPTAFLDLPSRVLVMGLLADLVSATGISVLLATHHLEMALEYADRLWLLDRRGSLAGGAPEDVALSGLLEQTFASDGVAFDVRDGSFRLERSDREGPTIGVQGQGRVADWTARALRRVGYVALDGAASGAATVQTPAEPGQEGWRLEVAGEGCELASIGELIEALKQRLPIPPRAANTPPRRASRHV